MLDALASQLDSLLQLILENKTENKFGSGERSREPRATSNNMVGGVWALGIALGMKGSGRTGRVLKVHSADFPLFKS